MSCTLTQAAQDIAKSIPTDGIKAELLGQERDSPALQPGKQSCVCPRRKCKYWGRYFCPLCWIRSINHEQRITHKTWQGSCSSDLWILSGIKYVLVYKPGDKLPYISRLRKNMRYPILPSRPHISPLKERDIFTFRQKAALWLNSRKRLRKI